MRGRLTGRAARLTWYRPDTDALTRVPSAKGSGSCPYGVATGPPNVVLHMRVSKVFRIGPRANRPTAPLACKRVRVLTGVVLVALNRLRKNCLRRIDRLFLGVPRIGSYIILRLACCFGAFFRSPSSATQDRCVSSTPIQPHGCRCCLKHFQHREPGDAQ
jgi:hypothetical protein